jgi:TorA maturation chaperone TorD
MASVSPVFVERPLAAEEAARGDYYALLARFFARPADGALLASLAGASALPEGAEPEFARAWRDLTAAASAMDEPAAQEEYDALFGGVGKSPVSIYAGSYAGASAVEHPRVRIQADLAAAGLAHRVPTEPEDHFAALFDAMRVLAAGGAGRAPAPIAAQRRFFESHVKPAAPKFFARLAAEPQANFYRRVAALGQAFVALESESFSLD